MVDGGLVHSECTRLEASLKQTPPPNKTFVRLSPSDISGYSTHDTVSPSSADIVLLKLSSPAANGGEAVAVAVLMMWTASTLACVSVWFPVQESASSVGQKAFGAGKSTFRGGVLRRAWAKVERDKVIVHSVLPFCALCRGICHGQVLPRGTMSSKSIYN